MKCISIFKCNPQIEVIDKSHCSLEDVPNFQNYQRSLEELFLDANKLTSLNDNVFKLTKLRKFSFSDNAIQDIPPNIGKLVNLVELDCSRNNIQIIPDTIKFLRGLQICDFSANNIEYLPSTLVQLKNLTCLTLNYCPIKNLPEDFGLLKNLESLELRENELESLPNSITGLESLRKLDLGRNLITQLPEDIGKLSRLEYLLVDGNRLETVPSKIGRLENLQCLDLSQQEYGLQYLPEEIRGLHSLTDLHLSENHLQSLPDGIGNLTSLTIFKADNNYLTELNHNISGCVALQELVLTSNRITRLPASIGNLGELRSFNADSNLLKELVPQVGNLKSLGILSLRDNLLTHLPSEIGLLEQARVMDFSGNRLEYLPASIAALNLKALWLSKNQAQPLPKLQIDELPGYQTRVLTCYLLPQQSEIDDHVDEVDQTDYDGDDYERERPVVSFDTAAVVDDVEFSNDANFVRHDTPHPRELKARHQKLFTNTNTNLNTNIITDTNANTNTNTNIPKQELKGHDNASFFMADNPTSYGEEVAEPQPRLPLEYESNGLPEVPPPISQEARVPYDDIVNSDSSPRKNIIYTTLVKDYKYDLGLVLENRTSDYDTRSNWYNIVIADILDNSIASRDGKLQIDDRLLTINGTDVTGIDLDRIMLMLEGTERFIRIVVSRGENDDPLGVALRNMPARPQLGSWFSSTSNMSHRPSLLESYQRPSFGSFTSLAKHPQLQGTKPPKPPKPTHLLSRENSPHSPDESSNIDENNPIARPRIRSAGASGLLSSDPNVVPQVTDAEKRAAWRQERLKSIEDDVEMAKLIAEAQRRRREESLY